MSYPNTPGWKGASDTGRLAAEAYYDKARGRRRAILGSLLDDGPGTAEEIAERLGWHWYLVRPRLSELSRLGLARDSGERGTGAFGGKTVRWRLATAEEQAAATQHHSDDKRSAA